MTEVEKSSKISIAETHPELLGEWDFSKNRVDPKGKSRGSRFRAWWICRTCKESWCSRIDSRTYSKTHCPFCQNRRVSERNCLAKRDPFKICLDWHPDNLITPTQVLPFSKLKVKWICSYGHVWRATIANRSLGQGCPGCRWEKSKICHQDSLLETSFNEIQE